MLENGFRVINCAWKPLYIVGNVYKKDRYGFEDILNWNVYEWKHWWDQSVAYPNALQVEPTDQVIGAQVCIWGTTYEQEISRAVENLGAMSERVWNITPISNYDHMIESMQKVVFDAFRLIAEK